MTCGWALAAMCSAVRPSPPQPPDTGEMAKKQAWETPTNEKLQSTRLCVLRVRGGGGETGRQRVSASLKVREDKMRKSKYQEERSWSKRVCIRYIGTQDFPYRLLYSTLLWIVTSPFICAEIRVVKSLAGGSPNAESHSLTRPSILTRRPHNLDWWTTRLSLEEPPLKEYNHMIINDKPRSAMWCRRKGIAS